MNKQYGWGILGPGRIAGLTTKGPLLGLPGVRRVAVGSRSKERAEKFAGDYGFERAYGSYEEFARDPEVEIVYVSTPHTGHEEHTIMCLEAGKNVLCEKPMAVNARQVQRMIDAAKRNNRFLAEATYAFWIPSLRQVKAWIDEGRIGEVRMLWASSGFIIGNPDPQGRLLNPILAGGALLDMGVYAVSLAHHVFGAPVSIKASGVVGETGVDLTEAMVFQYGGGELAVLSSSIWTGQRNDAVIQGTKGKITLPAPWAGRREAVLTVDGQDTAFEETEAHQLFKAETFADHAKSWMVADVMACLDQGLLESPTHPLQLSLEVAQSLDEIRRQIGVSYPADSL